MSDAVKELREYLDHGGPHTTYEPYEIADEAITALEAVLGAIEVLRKDNPREAVLMYVEKIGPAHYRTAAPAMAKALQEVIALHVETGGKECLTCTDERGPKPYPCPTVQAILDHLGEQE